MREGNHRKKQADDDHLLRMMRWRQHVHQAEARLEQDAAEARRRGMSYGSYMAAVHDSRIRRA